MVDAIRAGKAPAVIRRKGAEGDLPLPLEEKLEVLTILARDSDEAIRKKALVTLYGWNPQELQQVFSNPATHPAVLDFAVNYLATGREDVLEALLLNPNLPHDLRDEIQSHLLRAAQQAPDASVPTPPPAELPATKAESGEGQDRETLIEKVNRMSVVEKIKAALTGNQETRMILIRDSNKLVARAVLQSPKLSDAEIESYASAKNVSEEVLRLIAMNRAFMKTYSVIRAMINNPRAPINVSLPLLNRLNDRDLKMLTQNRNVPEVIRGTAVKMMKQKEQAAKPKLPSGKH